MIRKISYHYLTSLYRSPLFIMPPRIKTSSKLISRVTMSREDDSGSDEEPKQQLNDPNIMEPEQLQTIRSLNKLFYYDYTLSYQELKDLIIGTFKKLYRIKLEVRENQICFVVYPEVKSEDDFEYKQEMDAIAMVLTDYAMKEYLYDELKKITLFQRGVIVIPLHIDMQQN